MTDEGIFVSHFVPSRKGKREWTFPDEMDIQLVEEEQILQRSIPISYLQSARIRCCIEQTAVDSIEAKIQELFMK